MGASVRPADDLDSLIAARRKAVAQSGNIDLRDPPGHQTHPDTVDSVDRLIADRRALLESTKPSLTDRVLSGVGGAISHAISHPIDTAESLIVAPVKSAIDAVLTPEVGESRPNAALSKGGNSSGRPIERGTYDAEHGAQPQGARKIAALQTVVNVGLPGVAGAVGKRLGTTAAAATVGAMGGAAYSPDDPVAGALTGAILGPAAHGVVKGAGAGALGMRAIGERALDVMGRPDVSQPLIGVGGKGVGRVASVAERAAQLNERKLGTVPVPDSNKPLAPVDVNVSAQRLARGLKTSSPAAETVLRDALEPRAAGAVDRVIEHGLETSGLQSRESGLQVVDDLIAQRAQHGEENFQPLFARHDAPIDNPVFAEIAQTPAGQQALKRGMTIAANRGEKIGTLNDELPAPAGIKPEDWANTLRLAKERGIEMPKVEGQARIAPTLKQAHYIKLGFDDMLQSAPEPGSGGSGPNNAAAIRKLKNRWLGAMDEAAPEYATARKTFADESDLIRAADLGRTLFRMHPDEAAKAFREMSTAERDVARRSGFDALAERVENGPVDVERGVAKPRDQRRMRLLFPDDASFKQFQDGLTHEAQMHATTQGVLGGSNTADKLADMAGMAGVTIPDVMHAATGRPGALLRKAGAAILRSSTTEQGNRLAAERARQLVAGAEGRPRVQSPPPPRSAPIQTPPKRLPPARFPFGDMQGQAMPIPQPLPMNRRLSSGPPVGVPTTGDAPLGPSIPTGGATLEQVIREAAIRRYRQEPRVAITMGPEHHEKYLADMRQAVVEGRDPSSVQLAYTPESWREADNGNATPEVRARTAGGSLKSLARASEEELAGEYAALVDANAQENTAPTALDDESGGGPKYVGVKRGAAHAMGRVAQRKKSIEKIEAEMERRGINPIDAYRRARGFVDEGEDDTSFDFGANVR